MAERFLTPSPLSIAYWLRQRWVSSGDGEGEKYGMKDKYTTGSSPPLSIAVQI
jgi:hypothetical protein